MENNYKFYDQICAAGLKWLIYNARESKKDICFTNINSIDNEDKWLLSLAGAQSLLDGTKFYTNINFADYLVLKYKYKFKYFIIDGHRFEDEFTKSYNISCMTLSQIYDEYYRR